MRSPETIQFVLTGTQATQRFRVNGHCPRHIHSCCLGQPRLDQAQSAVDWIRTSALHRKASILIAILAWCLGKRRRQNRITIVCIIFIIIIINIIVFFTFGISFFRRLHSNERLPWRSEWRSTLEFRLRRWHCFRLPTLLSPALQ